MMYLKSLFITLLSMFSFCSLNILAAHVQVTIKAIDDNPVEDIVVYLMPKEGQDLSKVTSNPVVISQSDKKFVPYLTVAQKNTLVSFTNQDDITHHIYSATSKNRFNFRLKSGEENKTKVTATGRVLMGCNVHDWMTGNLKVVDTPLFGKSNSEGQVVIDVPVTGSYDLIAWHPQLNEPAKQKVKQIQIEGELSVTLQLTEKMNPVPTQENPESFDFVDDY